MDQAGSVKPAATRHTPDPQRLLDALADMPRPLLRPTPRAIMFFPLVVLVAVLPGLYALNRWDLTPPGPWWGLRGLAVREGMILDQVPLAAHWTGWEQRGYRQVALQPPLYAWLEGAGLCLSPTRHPLLTVLPSYIGGALLVVLVFLHGRIWFGSGVGVTAAFLTAFNRELLVQMQQATPSTIASLAILGSLMAYAQQVRQASRWSWTWILVGGLCLGLALMTVGPFALVVIPITVLHQALIGVDAAKVARRPSRWWRALWSHTSLPAGIASLSLGLAIALPWHAWMGWHYGGEFWTALGNPPHPFWDDAPAGMLGILLALTPATLALSLLQLARLCRYILAADDADTTVLGGSFWISWLACTALLPVLWPGEYRPSQGLLLLVPLNLLAARTMAELAERKIPAKNLIWLAPATALTVAWWLSGSLRYTLANLGSSRLPDAQSLLRLHLGLDLILILALATRLLDRWARRRDPRRRLVLGMFLLTILALNTAAGLREVRFRHSETSDLLDLRTEILRRNLVEPFQVLAVVGGEPGNQRLARTSSPGGRLRFMLRSALPGLAQLDLNSVDELLGLPEQQRLVIQVGADKQLPYKLQSQLKLEMIHPGRSGVLNAFATTYSNARRYRP